MSRRYITTVSILIGLPVLVLVIFSRTIIDTVTSLDFWSAHWGDVASVSGLVVAWYGFILTICIASKSKSAAESAQKAAEETRDSVGYFDSIVQLGRAETLMEEIIRSHRGHEWVGLPTRYDRIRELLAPLKNPSSRLDRNQQAKIGGVLKQLKDIHQKIDRSPLVEQGKPPTGHMKFLDILKDQKDHLVELLGDLRTSRGE